MKKILVVDDAEEIRIVIKKLLKNEGYKVITVLSGKEALAKLKKQKVDLVLVDHFMPQMSGRELCEEIRKDPKLRNLKLIFLTVAQYGKEGYKEMKKLKIADYIRKPFITSDLIARVKKIVGK